MRRKDREVTDANRIFQIISSAQILHLGLNDGKYPYIVPVHYGFEYFDDNLTFYIHCAKEGHKLDLINDNPNVCVELDTNISLIPGGNLACSYSSTYSSLIGFGQASIVSDETEKVKSLNLLMFNQTGRLFDFDQEAINRVNIIKINIDNFSVKERR